MIAPGGLDPIAVPAEAPRGFGAGAALRGIKAFVERRSLSRSTVPAAVIPGSESVHLGGGEIVACPGIERVPLVMPEVGYGVGSPSLALPPAKVSGLRGVRLVAGQGVVIDQRGAVVAESITSEMLEHLDHDELRRARGLAANATVSIDGPVAVFRSAWRSQYHTLVDHLPRAALLAQPAMARFGEISLIHDGDLNEFERVMLHRLLPARVRLVRVEPYDVVTADTVLVPSYVTRAGAGAIPSWYRRWVDRQMTALLHDAGQDAAALPRRFFIDRPDARQIRNNADFKAVLAAHDVSILDLSGLTATEVIRAFRDASLVLGTTGSDLANAVFSRSARIIELLPGQQVLPHLYYLAASKGLAYDFVPAATSPGGDPPGTDEGITVDLAALEKLLSR